MSCASNSGFQDIWLGATDVKDHFKSAEMVLHALESLWLFETGISVVLLRIYSIFQTNCLASA